MPDFVRDNIVDVAQREFALEPPATPDDQEAIRQSDYREFWIDELDAEPWDIYSISEAMATRFDINPGWAFKTARQHLNQLVLQARMRGYRQERLAGRRFRWSGPEADHPACQWIRDQIPDGAVSYHDVVELMQEAKQRFVDDHPRARTSSTTGAATRYGRCGDPCRQTPGRPRRRRRRRRSPGGSDRRPTRCPSRSGTSGRTGSSRHLSTCGTTSTSGRRCTRNTRRRTSRCWGRGTTRRRCRPSTSRRRGSRSTSRRSGWPSSRTRRSTPTSGRRRRSRRSKRRASGTASQCTTPRRRRSSWRRARTTSSRRSSRSPSGRRTRGRTTTSSSTTTSRRSPTNQTTALRGTISENFEEFYDNVSAKAGATCLPHKSLNIVIGTRKTPEDVYREHVLSTNNPEWDDCIARGVSRPGWAARIWRATPDWHVIENETYQVHATNGEVYDSIRDVPADVEIIDDGIRAGRDRVPDAVARVRGARDAADEGRLEGRTAARVCGGRRTSRTPRQPSGASSTSTGCASSTRSRARTGRRWSGTRA